MKYSALCVFLLLSGCGGANERLVLGRIMLNISDEQAFVAPDTARAGETFTVQVLTDVGCFIRPGRVDVLYEERRAILTPYDIEISSDEICLLQPTNPFTHEVELLFEESGEVELILRALRSLTYQPVELTRVVHLN
jgi:hypothetical protein